MDRITALLQTALQITPEGSCCQHPEFSVVVSAGSNLAKIRRCELCSVEAQPFSLLQTSSAPTEELELLNSIISRWCEVNDIDGESLRTAAGTENSSSKVDQDDVICTPTVATSKTNPVSAATRDSDKISALEKSIKEQANSIQQLHRTMEEQNGHMQQTLNTILGAMSSVRLSPTSERLQREGKKFLDMEQASEKPQILVGGELLSPDASVGSVFHPGSLFSQVRTNEKQPPKPPQRHGSFSARMLKKKMTDISSRENLSIASDTTSEQEEEITIEFDDEEKTEPFPDLESYDRKDNEIVLDGSQFGEGRGVPCSTEELFLAYDPAAGNVQTKRNSMDTRSKQPSTERPKMPRRLKSLQSAARSQFGKESQETTTESQKAAYPPKYNVPTLSQEKVVKVPLTKKRSFRPNYFLSQTKGSGSKVSSLTIDTILVTNDEGPDLDHDEVTNHSVTDPFGEKGMYTGTIVDMRLPSGTGMMKYESGGFYNGTWRDGHWHGRGLLRNANGDSYEGDFVYDARHGRGVYKYMNGDVYEGDFSSDKRHGKGTFMFQNGNTYRGDFVYGSFDGYGWYDFAEGYYEGQWKNGNYEGIGTLQYSDGSRYTGRFKEGIAHGMGEEISADGIIRRGYWVKGELEDGVRPVANETGESVEQCP